MEEGWAQGEGGLGCIWWMCFGFIYENRRVKPVEIVLKRWGGGKRKNDGQDKSN
jgi:hypothetical protein